jgi:hypothetical protein
MENFFRGKFHFFPTFSGGKFSTKFSPEKNVRKIGPRSQSCDRCIYNSNTSLEPILRPLHLQQQHFSGVNPTTFECAATTPALYQARAFSSQ